MKNLFATFSLIALCFTSCKKEEKVETTITTETDTTYVTKTAEADTATAAPLDTVAMQKAWEAYATPGDMHKMLAEENGKWDVEISFWMDANSEPQTDKATAEAKMVMGGRYQEVLYKGKVMGTDWEGKSTAAYNNKTKEVTYTFIDNMGTGMMVTNGTYDPETKAINLKGETTDPMTGKMISYREVYTIVDDKTRKMEMFDTKDGKPEYKSMQILMTRK